MLIFGKNYIKKSGLLDDFKRGKRYLWANRDAVYKVSCSVDKMQACSDLEAFYNEVADAFNLVKRVRYSGNNFQFCYIVALIDSDNQVLIIKETSCNRYYQYYPSYVLDSIMQ